MARTKRKKADAPLVVTTGPKIEPADQQLPSVPDSSSDVMAQLLESAGHLPHLQNLRFYLAESMDWVDRIITDDQVMLKELARDQAFLTAEHDDIRLRRNDMVDMIDRETSLLLMRNEGMQRSVRARLDYYRGRMADRPQHDGQGQVVIRAERRKGFSVQSWLGWAFRWIDIFGFAK